MFKKPQNHQTLFGKIDNSLGKLDYGRRLLLLSSLVFCYLDQELLFTLCVLELITLKVNILQLLVKLSLENLEKIWKFGKNKL
jgi:hypothetical protein